MEEMIAREPLDAIDICLPTGLHRKATELAAAKGLHVFCEKPIAATEEDAQAMIDACKSAGVVLMIGHVVRFNPESLAARQQMLSGSIGKPGIIRTTRVSEFPSWASWFSDYGSSGTLLDMAIHDFDFLRWCLGPVSRVFTTQVIGERLDHSMTIVRFASGAMAHVEASWAYPPGTVVQAAIEIAGSNGLAVFDRPKSYPIHTFFRDGGGSAVPDNPLAKNAYVRELEHFLTCIATKQTPLTSGEESLQALRISLAALESAKTGLPVELEAMS
jgi:predicted dehydrogenase